MRFFCVGKSGRALLMATAVILVGVMGCGEDNGSPCTCNEDNDSGTNTGNGIVDGLDSRLFCANGDAWVYREEDFCDGIILKSDGGLITFRYFDGDWAIWESVWKWRLSGNRLIAYDAITGVADGDTLNYTVSGNELRLWEHDEDPKIYIKMRGVYQNGVINIDMGDNTSDRDGSYEYVEIGGKKWMTKNLNIETADSWCYGDGGQVFDYENGTWDTWKTLTNSEVQANCAKYGRLYTWSAAKSACPKGWKLPTREDWDALSDYAASRPKKVYFTSDDDTFYYWPGAGRVLKSKSGWNGFNGIDSLGFSALPGGYRIYNDGSFINDGIDGIWWTATEYGSGSAYDRGMGNSGDDVFENGNDKDKGFSVRCIADN